jgi:hypothetical protein
VSKPYSIMPWRHRERVSYPTAPGVLDRKRIQGRDVSKAKTQHELGRVTWSPQHMWADFLLALPATHMGEKRSRDFEIPSPFPSSWTMS